VPAPLLHPAGLQQAIQTAVRHGTIHPQSAEIACRALDFGALRLSEVMVPRNRVKAIAYDTPLTHLRRILLEEAYSRMPVYDGTLDAIVGILVAKDALALAWEEKLVVLDDVLQAPFFAPETMHAADLLKELQSKKLHFAVVVDELGGTAGIVTLEDLLEELVGNIYGQHDDATPELIHHDADGTITVEGMMPVRDANRELHLALPEGDTFCTVGGLCVSHAGRIPEAGYKLAYDDNILEVVEASPRSVTRVRLRRRARPAAGPPAQDGIVAAGS
jgi:putative hemolysin